MKIFHYSIVFFFFVHALNIASPIKLYAMYTPSHEVLLRDWFLPSIQDSFELKIELHEQDCPDGHYKHQGWTTTTGKKVDLIIRAIEENMGDFFVFSDVDIQFFRPIAEIITQLMEEYDLVVQKNHPHGTLCSGFFVCRATEKTLALWRDVREYMRNHKGVSDQGALNACLVHHGNPYNVSWSLLPDEFFSAGTFTGTCWNAKKSLYIPVDIVLHHANWTEGVDQKIAQLDWVKRRVALQKSLHNPKRIR